MYDICDIMGDGIGKPSGLWCTRVRAINPATGEIADYTGPKVPGKTRKEAEEYCNTHGLGYCSVDGQFIMEVTLHYN